MLVVSPHFDDAILSAYALLTQRATALTVFSGAPDPPQQTTWDRLTGFRDSSQAMKERAFEDANAFSLLRAERSEVGLLDHQYVSSRDTSDERRLLNAVSTWVGKNRSGFVAVPAGTGRNIDNTHEGSGTKTDRAALPGDSPPHPDVVWVGEVIARAFGDDLILVVYEDLPYAWSQPADDRAHTLSRIAGRRAQPVTLPINVVQKAASLDHYKSQRSRIFSPSVQAIADVLPNSERYWLLAAD
jgi:hypothetical protein